MSSPRNRVALITGVSRSVGIGAATARELVHAVEGIFITYYRPYDREAGMNSDPGEPESLLAELRHSGLRADGLELDLSDPKAPSYLFDQAEARIGRVTILVNNATHSVRDGIDNLTADHLDRHYAVNLRAMSLLCAEFVRRYKRNWSPDACGRIINLSSGQGLAAMPGELAYAATKAGIEGFTRSLSAELAKFGVTVNAVDPGPTDTGWISSDLREKLKAEAPMHRIGRPEDAARLIRFLASAEAEWITGQVMHSRGGL